MTPYFSPSIHDTADRLVAEHVALAPGLSIVEQLQAAHTAAVVTGKEWLDKGQGRVASAWVNVAVELGVRRESHKAVTA